MSAPHAGGGAGRKHSDSHSETRQPKASRNKLQASKSTPFKMLFFAAPRNNEIVTRKRCQFLPRSGSGSSKKRRKKQEQRMGALFLRTFLDVFLVFFLFRGIVKPRKCLQCQFHSDKSFQERRLLHKVDFSGWWVIATQQLLTLSNLPLYVYILMCL